MKTILAILVLLACSQAIAAETLMVFSASWCGACRQFKADLAKDPSLTGDSQIVNVDVETERDTVRRYRVKAMPTFIVIEDGREVRRQVGYEGAARFKRWLER